VARGLQDLEPHVAELDPIAVLQRDALELRLGPAAEVDRGPGPVAELDVARDEVGMEVGEEDVLDRVAARLGIGQVPVDVTLRIDHRGGLRLFIRDHVRRMRQAGEVVLLDVHGSSLRW
jgi:hypothetical protein